MMKGGTPATDLALRLRSAAFGWAEGDDLMAAARYAIMIAVTLQN